MTAPHFGQPGAPAQGQPPVPQGMPQYTPQPPTQPTIIRDNGGYGFPQTNLPPVQTQQPVPATQMQPPVTQQQAPMTQNPPPGTVALSSQTVLDGPEVPAELRGRTLSDVLRIYGGLAQFAIQQSRAAQPPQPAAQPQGFQPQPGQTPQGQPQTQGWDWKNPRASVEQAVEATVSKLFEQRLAPMLAPMVQSHNMSAINAARDLAFREVNNPQIAGQLLPAVQQLLNGADPGMLANPEVWRMAIRSAYGDMAMRGQLPNGQPKPNGQQPQPNGFTPAGPYPVQTPQGVQPVPNLGGFFSEPPSGVASPLGVELTPLQEQVREAMGMDRDTYVAWMVGAQSRKPAGAP